MWHSFPPPVFPITENGSLIFPVAQASPAWEDTFIFCCSDSQPNQKILSFLSSKSAYSPITAYHLYHSLLPSFWYVPPSCFTRIAIIAPGFWLLSLLHVVTLYALATVVLLQHFRHDVTSLLKTLRRLCILLRVKGTSSPWPTEAHPMLCYRSEPISDWPLHSLFLLPETVLSQISTWLIPSLSKFLLKCHFLNKASLFKVAIHSATVTFNPSPWFLFFHITITR